MARRETMASWVLPTAVYVLALGGLGITTKLALKHMSWPSLILWTTATYIVVSAVILLGKTGSLSTGPGLPMAMLSAALAVGGLISFYVALGRGEASLVVPVSSVYPLVTVALSAIVLAERLSPTRALGALVVVVGLVIVTRG